MPGSFDGCSRGHDAHVGGGHRSERSAELADGRADGREDVYVVQTEASKLFSLALEVRRIACG